jgi:hypothetical protein
MARTSALDCLVPFAVLGVSGRRALALRRFKEEAVLAHTVLTHVVRSPPTIVLGQGELCKRLCCDLKQPGVMERAPGC